MDVNTGAGAGFFSSPKGDLVFKMSDFNKFQFIELRSLESLHKGFFKIFVFNLHVCVCLHECILHMFEYLWSPEVAVGPCRVGVKCCWDMRAEMQALVTGRAANS